jgi:hypothetical protein
MSEEIKDVNSTIEAEAAVKKYAAQILLSVSVNTNLIFVKLMVAFH